MNQYIWQHRLEGEAVRLRLMSTMLDPTSINHLERLPLGSDWTCLEIGAGNGSLSRWLAVRLGPHASVIATDIAPELMEGIATSNLEVRKLDVVKDGLPRSTYDLVMARAIAPPRRADGGDGSHGRIAQTRWLSFHSRTRFLPNHDCRAPDQTQFWRDFLGWAEKHNIDHFVGRKVAPCLQRLGMTSRAAQGHTFYYPGGSEVAEWWRLGIGEVAELMLEERATAKARLDHFFELNRDPIYWTMTIDFIATSGQRLAS